MPRPERKNKKSQSKHAHGLALPASSSEPVFHSDHERLLATKWMGPTKLAELVKSEGLVYTKGKFTASEIKQINGALENYRTSRGLTEEEVNNIMFARDGKHKDNSFWSEISLALTRRPICAVYHYLRRAHHPMKQQGKWRPEEDAQLMQSVVSLGQQWEKIAPLVGRMAPDCRDRYRNHIVDQEKRNTGTWSAAEEEELTRIVVDMQKGKDLDHDVFWGRVSELMGGKRSRQQCRMKWTDSLSSKHRSHGQQMLRWSARDASIFIHRIDSLNVQDEADIPWKSLRDPQWDLWSPHVLQRRWSNMKKKIKGFENMSHPEIMDILRLKIVQSTQSVTNGDAEPRAGSSTGQGTLTRQVIDEDDSEDSE
ncbi:hypothetical protein B0H15DRAFT_775989 [Mycena belliarum]|uniref:Uncharacterized protein n=1 Tax=Mycena belliarum TaxID=1033014 RepID=A0AAD6U836_9AGAR|nr:hypothetical protein B0H15DRAFT_775989 [Mycena belliae]